MIGLDTNILLRLLVNDDREQVEAVHDFLTRYGNKPDTYYINLIVLAEFAWVVQSRYKRGRSEIVGAVLSLLNAPAIRIESRDTVAAAVSLYQNAAADFSDCLIAASNLAAGCDHTATFDFRAQAIEGMRSP